MIIRSPAELKKRSLPELDRDAEDLRQLILSTCLKNGGHLGASLGAVELAIALHFVFDSPREPIVWDVGHQAYAHKIITDRADQFLTLRQFGGISGFLSRAESKHDVFGAGHSSTSLSAMLAMAWARQGTRDWSVAVIGDGGLTAGIAFEALNCFRAKPTGPALIVLNDNQMSIAPNVGAIPKILSGGNAKEFFGLYGFEYVGPIDGHNLELLIGTLRGIRESEGTNPILLHVLTQKGKGYAPAEENPGEYHGVGPIKSASTRAKVGDHPAPARQGTFSEAFGTAMCELAKEDPKLLAITAAMPDGTGLIEFSQTYPERFFDVGIAEPHAVTFAAGLATQGFKPVVAVYSTFLQRALDSMIHDVALQNLPVIFAIDRAGWVGADGPTHHGAFDLAYCGMIPGFNLFAPETLSDVEVCLRQALQLKGPSAIRYPRGSAVENSSVDLEGGVRWNLRANEPKVLLVSVGTSGKKIEKLSEKFRKQRNISWVSLIQAKPLPETLLQYIGQNPRMKIISIEDGVVHGGIGQQLRANRIFGYGDHFTPHGPIEKLEAAEGLSSQDIERAINEVLETSKQ